MRCSGFSSANEFRVNLASFLNNDSSPIIRLFYKAFTLVI